jgi:hypothetical protein
MHPQQAGFDVFRGNMGAALNTFWQYEYVVQDAATGPTELRAEPIPEKSLPGIAATTYAPVVKTADAIEWITAREAEDPDAPWFTWLAFNLSHATSSRQPSQMIVPNADTLDPVALEEMRGCATAFATADLGSCSGEAVNRAMTTSLDTVLGKLLDAVECKAVHAQLGVEWAHDCVQHDVGRAAFGHLQLEPSRLGHQLGIEHGPHAAQLAQHQGAAGLGQAGEDERGFLRAEAEVLQEEVAREFVAHQLADVGQGLVLGAPASARRKPRAQVDLFAGGRFDGLEGPGGERGLGDGEA